MRTFLVALVVLSFPVVASAAERHSHYGAAAYAAQAAPSAPAAAAASSAPARQGPGGFCRRP